MRFMRKPYPILNCSTWRFGTGIKGAAAAHVDVVYVNILLVINDTSLSQNSWVASYVPVFYYSILWSSSVVKIPSLAIHKSGLSSNPLPIRL
ncbi:hypothetical protein CEB3_c01490 [Peptococcaceae bacterium CEB3]|nr:hypothetical protein CEB3_c01490 [Peptococcaceae bacterium CEB3]